MFVSETLSLYVALSLLKHYFIDLFFFYLTHRSILLASMYVHHASAVPQRPEFRSAYERECVVFVFLSLGYCTQCNFSQCQKAAVATK